MLSIDLSADVGEGLAGIDAELIGFLSSASIACGGHAGSDKTMRQTLSVCMTSGTRLGAHPSYPDAEHFGRVSMDISHESLLETILTQTSRLVTLAEEAGGRVAYLKPHGALYNDAAKGSAIGSVLIEACQQLELRLMCLAGAPLQQTAAEASLGYIREGFADRRYSPEGALLPRQEQGAVIMNPDEAADRALKLAGSVDSICIHSDTPGAKQIAAAVRQKLERSGWEIRA